MNDDQPEQPGLRTGSGIFHLIPGSLQMIAGGSMLLVCLKRSRKLPPGKSFAELHIPESDPSIIMPMSWMVMSVTLFAILMEGVGAWRNLGDPFAQLPHQVLYFSFFFSGIIAQLEVKRRLPMDSHRAGLSVAFLISFLLLRAHTKMKPLAVDRELHSYLSYISLLTSIVIAYSMRCTDSVLAYIASFSLVLLMGLFTITIGFYEWGTGDGGYVLDIPLHSVVTYFTLEIALVGMTVTLGYAFFGPKPRSDQENRVEIHERDGLLAEDDRKNESEGRETDSDSGASSDHSSV